MVRHQRTNAVVDQRFGYAPVQQMADAYAKVNQKTALFSDLGYTRNGEAFNQERAIKKVVSQRDTTFCC
jgi:hypothetical protein